MENAFERQKTEQLRNNDRSWQLKLEAVNRWDTWTPKLDNTKGSSINDITVKRRSEILWRQNKDPCNKNRVDGVCVCCIKIVKNYVKQFMDSDFIYHTKRVLRRDFNSFFTFSRTFEDQLEQRLRLQQEQEAELEELISVDADAFNDTKRRMERDIALLSDQIQFLDAIHQVSVKFYKIF